jgi:hypothetical protein
MARRKKEQKVELVNKSGAKSLLSLEHANRILAYQKKKASNAWEVSPDCDYQYHEKDGIIKKSSIKSNQD